MKSVTRVPFEQGEEQTPTALFAVIEPVETTIHQTMDEWGRDAGFVRAVAPFGRLRWNVKVRGHANLPDGGALIVVNTRRLALTVLSTALGLTSVLDRPVRFVGRPDMVPFGPMLQRVGGLLAESAEIAGALRAGELVLLGTHGISHPRHAGFVDHELVAAATREDVPVHVAASVSSRFSRATSVVVSTEVIGGRERRGPLAEVELAARACRRLQDLLDELGA